MSLPGKREGSARFVMVEDSGGQRLALEKMRTREPPASVQEDENPLEGAGWQRRSSDAEDDDEDVILKIDFVVAVDVFDMDRKTGARRPLSYGRPDVSKTQL